MVVHFYYFVAASLWIWIIDYFMNCDGCDVVDVIIFMGGATVGLLCVCEGSVLSCRRVCVIYGILLSTLSNFTSCTFLSIYIYILYMHYTT